MSQIEVQILSQNYLLTCPDGHEAQLMEAVERVDEQFKKMRDTSKLRLRERVGVLLAVNLAYENLQLRQQLQALQQQVAQSQTQSSTDSEQTELDTKRLAELEAQAVLDQQAAAALVQRLDQVLLGHHTATDASTDAQVDDVASNEEHLNTFEQAPAMDATLPAEQAGFAIPDDAANTISDNLVADSLATADAENL